MGWIKDLYDVAANAVAGVGKTVRAIRRVPIIDELLEKARFRFLNPVVIRRITNPNDPDLARALDLYERRIPETQRFESSDIVRWLSEDLEYRSKIQTGPRDVFLVAKYHRRVCGFSLFHYYPTRRLAFFAYLATDHRPGIPIWISDTLVSKVAHFIRRKRPFRNCEGFLFEVEDPRQQPDNKSRVVSLARVRLFCRLAEMSGFTLRAIDFVYKQPLLTHTDGEPQQPLLLMFAPTAKRSGTHLAKDEVARLLEFIYMEVYPEGYSVDSEETARYKELCSRLKDELIDRLPVSLETLNLGQLVRQTRSVGRGNVAKFSKPSGA